MNCISLYPDRRETAWGIRYLLFELLVLPWMLNLANLYLGMPLDAAWLNLVYYGINFIAVLIVFRRFLKATLQHLLPQLPKVLSTAVIGLILYWAAMYVQSLVVFALVPDFVNVNDANIAAMVSGAFIPLALATTVLVPVTEELLFRGALFGGIYSHNPKAAWIISVCGFCLVHVTAYIGVYPWDTLLVCLVQYIPAGLCLAWAYRRSGSILTPMVMHAVINALGIIAMR